MTIKICRIARQLSAPLVILAAALFAAAVISGLFSYLGRSSVREKLIPGSSAWRQQLAVAIVALRSARAGGSTSGSSAAQRTPPGWSGPVVPDHGAQRDNT